MYTIHQLASDIERQQRLQPGIKLEDMKFTQPPGVVGNEFKNAMDSKDKLVSLFNGNNAKALGFIREIGGSNLGRLDLNTLVQSGAAEKLIALRDSNPSAYLKIRSAQNIADVSRLQAEINRVAPAATNAAQAASGATQTAVKTAPTFDLDDPKGVAALGLQGNGTIKALKINPDGTFSERGPIGLDTMSRLKQDDNGILGVSIVQNAKGEVTAYAFSNPANPQSVIYVAPDSLPPETRKIIDANAERGVLKIEPGSAPAAQPRPAGAPPAAPAAAAAVFQARDIKVGNATTHLEHHSREVSNIDAIKSRAPEIVVEGKAKTWSFDGDTLNHSRFAKMVENRMATPSSFTADLPGRMERLKKDGYEFNDYDRAAIKALQQDLASRAPKTGVENYWAKMVEIEKLSRQMGNPPTPNHPGLDGVPLPKDTAAPQAPAPAPAGAPPPAAGGPAPASGTTADLNALFASRQQYRSDMQAFYSKLDPEVKKLYTDPFVDGGIDPATQKRIAGTISPQQAANLKRFEDKLTPEQKIEWDKLKARANTVQTPFDHPRDVRPAPDVPLDTPPLRQQNTPVPAPSAPPAPPPVAGAMPVPPAPSAAATTPAVQTPNFEYSMSAKPEYNADVLKAQELMKQLKERGVPGIDLGPFKNHSGTGADGLDGKFGKMTRDSIVAVEKYLGIDPPTGKITDELVKKMEDKAAELASKPAPANAPAGASQPAPAVAPPLPPIVTNAPAVTPAQYQQNMSTFYASLSDDQKKVFADPYAPRPVRQVGFPDGGDWVNVNYQAELNDRREQLRQIEFFEKTLTPEQKTAWDQLKQQADQTKTHFNRPNDGFALPRIQYLFLRPEEEYQREMPAIRAQFGKEINEFYGKLSPEQKSMFTNPMRPFGGSDDSGRPIMWGIDQRSADGITAQYEANLARFEASLNPLQRAQWERMKSLSDIADKGFEKPNDGIVVAQPAPYENPDLHRRLILEEHKHLLWGREEGRIDPVTPHSLGDLRTLLENKLNETDIGRSTLMNVRQNGFSSLGAEERRVFTAALANEPAFMQMVDQLSNSKGVTEIIANLRKTPEGTMLLDKITSKGSMESFAGLTPGEIQLFKQASGGDAAIQRAVEQLFEHEDRAAPVNMKEGSEIMGSLDLEPPPVEEIGMSPMERLESRLNKTEAGQDALANLREGGFDQLSQEEKELVAAAAGGEAGLREVAEANKSLFEHSQAFVMSPAEIYSSIFDDGAPDIFRMQGEQSEIDNMLAEATGVDVDRIAQLAQNGKNIDFSQEAELAAMASEMGVKNQGVKLG